MNKQIANRTIVYNAIILAFRFCDIMMPNNSQQTVCDAGYYLLVLFFNHEIPTSQH
jgi:hypothetical protein